MVDRGLQPIQHRARSIRIRTTDPTFHNHWNDLARSQRSCLHSDFVYGDVLLQVPCMHAGVANECYTDGVFCDPQLGCSDRLVAQDLSDEHAWQLSQEFRLASNFSGPLNFSVGGNYLHYETEENYYVFINTLTLVAAQYYGNPGGHRPLSNTLGSGRFGQSRVSHRWLCKSQSLHTVTIRTDPGCAYIDPNPITQAQQRRP